MQIYRLRLPLSFYLLMFVALVAGSFAPFILDHFGYYVPTMSWIKTAGWFPGVANVEWVLGQMSFWHLLQAGFSNFADVFYRLNTVLLIGFILYAYEVRRKILLLFFPICLFFVQSPSPDLAVILLSLVFLNEILSQNKNYTALFALGILIFTIKPTMIWTPLLGCLYLGYHRQFRFKNLILGGFIALIYLGKNIVVSGYPLFPTDFITLHFPWTADVGNMVVSSQFALMKSYDMQYSYEFLTQQSLLQRVVLWLSLPGIKGFINLFLVVSWGFFTVFCATKRRRLLWGLYLSLAIKTIFVLYFSAQYRFFIDVFVVIYTVVFWDILKQKIITVAVSTASLMVLMFLAFPKGLTQLLPSFRPSQFMQGLQYSQWLRPYHYDYKKFTKLSLGNVQFYVVKGYPFLFDTPTPGITLYNLQQYLKMGYWPQYLKDKKGFYPHKLSESEATQLRQIIDKFQGKESAKK